jgi:hypothetical protein
VELSAQVRPQVIVGLHHQQVNPPSTSRSTPVQ